MANEMRLIDANALSESFEKAAYKCEHIEDMVFHLDYILDEITGADEVDAVPVVRCKDCDWYIEHEGGICLNPKCEKNWYGCHVPPEHFCSYGERREGE